MKKIYSVGIIGAGVSGCVNALQFAAHGIDSILFEKEETVVNGSPFCHLHAGGNLYPDISDAQCRILMKQSIAMAKLFPQSIDERPTFISIPKTEKYVFDHMQVRLDMLVTYYKQLIKEDASNEILGPPKDYYKIYNNEDLQRLTKNKTVAIPSKPDEWMANAIQLIDYNKLKTPVLLVQEFGWNLFRIGAQAQLALNKTDTCTLKLNTNVTAVKDVRHLNYNYNWEIKTEDSTFYVKYLVNSSGFKTGDIDNSLALKSERLIEFKAAYIAKWHPINGLLPELVFHGERGTPHGMAQLTPYCDDYYQIHGMTEEITLFKNGLVKSIPENVQPEFNTSIIEKLNNGWLASETALRTNRSIAYISNFVPSFETAIVGGNPLFGAQQIPGEDPTLRVGEVCFPTKFYARSEIIKASSALTVAHQIIGQLQKENIIDSIEEVTTSNSLLNSVSVKEIDTLAEVFTTVRGYPKALAHLVIKRNLDC